MTQERILEIRDLRARIDSQEILRGVDLSLGPGEVHAIMGPNGSGKSTLAHVLAGRESCEVTGGEVFYKGRNLLEMSPEERACEGIFLAFQYPVEIPGVTNQYFIRTALNAIRKHQGLEPLDAMEFLERIREKARSVDMDEALLKRAVNSGFSGGEKKRNEILQMALLDPALAVLDETDSGLDIDALRIVANGVNALRNEKHSVLVVTHYQRLLNYLVPDVVHVLVGGRIVDSGDRSLAERLEEEGYAPYEKELAANA